MQQQQKPKAAAQIFEQIKTTSAMAALVVVVVVACQTTAHRYQSVGKSSEACVRYISQSSLLSSLASFSFFPQTNDSRHGSKASQKRSRSFFVAVIAVDRPAAQDTLAGWLCGYSIVSAYLGTK